MPSLSAAEADALACRAWGRAGRVLAEYPHLQRFLSEPERLQIEIREPVATFSDPSRPSVFVSAHQSNWEVVASALAQLDIPNANLYSPPTNPLLDGMLHESRKALNCELLPRDNSARLLLRALKQGRSAGLVVDRRVDDGKPVRFFGRDKLATVLPAWLALKAGCELVPAQVQRLRDARYRVIFHPPLRPRDRTAAPAEQAIDMTQQLHNLFENWIRAEPQDWLCSKRIWPRGTEPAREVMESGAEVESHAA